MNKFLNSLKMAYGVNDKLYYKAMEGYALDLNIRDTELDALYNLILDRLVFPVGKNSAERIMYANRRDLDGKNWMFSTHPIEKFNADMQQQQNELVLLELQLLHRSKTYMTDFLKENKLWVETDPFGSDELMSEDNLNEREMLYSPILSLCFKGKKAIQKKFSGGGTPPASQK